MTHRSLPSVTLHLVGASGIPSMSVSFTHSKPSTHFPQSWLKLGLKQGPQTSPTCCVLDTGGGGGAGFSPVKKKVKIQQRVQGVSISCS